MKYCIIICLVALATLSQAETPKRETQVASDASDYRQAFETNLEELRIAYRKGLAADIASANRIEVVLLKFDDQHPAGSLPDPDGAMFVEQWKQQAVILEQKECSMEESKELLSEFSRLLLIEEHIQGPFCHFPVHGLKLYRDESLLFSGTFCWVCGNFGMNYPSGFEWLNTGSLKTRFEKLLPIPKEEIDRFKETYPGFAN